MPQATLLLLQLLATHGRVRIAILARVAGLDVGETRSRLDRLRAAELVANDHGLWRLTEAGREAAREPEPNGIEPYYARIWRALRQLVEADVEQLAVVCGQGERRPAHSANRYLLHLAAVGIVVRAGTRVPQRYALIPGTDPGPLAPRVRMVGGVAEVWEPNTGRRLPVPPSTRRQSKSVTEETRA